MYGIWSIILSHIKIGMGPEILKTRSGVKQNSTNHVNHDWYARMSDSGHLDDTISSILTDERVEVPLDHQ